LGLFGFPQICSKKGKEKMDQAELRQDTEMNDANSDSSDDFDIDLFPWRVVVENALQDPSRKALDVSCKSTTQQISSNPSLRFLSLNVHELAI
jgi:hypothetical protein